MTRPSAIADLLARHRLLLRGESLVGFVGIATAAILLAMIGSAGWWSVRGQQDAWRFVRDEQIRVLASIISQSAESAIASADLSALRRMLIEAEQRHELTECRIVLPDGRILADANPTKITLVNLPAQWPSGPLDEPADSSAAKAPDQITISQPLLIAGRGGAMLKISAKASTGATRLWETAAGFGLIGAAGLAATLLVYRRMRTKVIALGLIRESLLATQDSLASPDALKMRADSGPEAEAWNLLLEENETLRKASVAQRAMNSLGARREARSDLEHACDALSVGMIVIDEKACVKHVNGAATVLFQIKRDEIIGQDITTLIEDASVKEAIGVIAAGAGHRRTLEIRRTDEQGGGIIMRIHVRPMRRDDAGGALVTIEDITQQRVADQARDSFVAQATHELRTPLTNMRLCLESAIEDNDANPNAMREHFNVLNQETRRLERMVGEMLSVAQIEAGSLRLQRDDVRIDKLFEELLTDYKQQAAEKQIALSSDLPPKFPVIQGDRDKLMVTLHNMLGNALKYTEAGGKVSVTVRADASHLTVEVTDTGIGISPEEQQKIFEKFYRAKDARVGKISGSGLGLALAREIARLHGGDITVQSELNNGSTFTLSLPAHAQAKAA